MTRWLAKLSNASLWLLCGAAAAVAATPVTPADPDIAQLVDTGRYDAELCVTAQRMLLNAQPGDYVSNTLVATGGTFVTEQMNAERESRTVTVAALLETVTIGRKQLAVDMACKLINQDRARFVLQIDLPAPAATCRDVNELSYALALNSLTPAERQQYLEAGTPLRFAEDYKAAAGGEWLPSVVSDFIKPVNDAAGELEYLSVQAPSVQVPWPDGGGDWYEGTHHCKLITLAAMTRWMTTGALDGSTELFPRPRPKCVEPDSRTSVAGSCLLYFGPAGAQFCQDYSGSGWSEASAREDCLIRHATPDAWNAASDQYSGGGGIYSAASCAVRDAAAEAGRAPVSLPDTAYLGTCVFRCNTPDEALWHQLSPMAADPDGRMLERTCDLFLKVDW